MTSVSLDETDRKTVSVLQAEGRISNLDLAARIGLLPTPCSRRVKRLEKAGVIMGHGAKVNSTAMGYGVSVMVNVRLSRLSPSDITGLLSAVQRLREITECLLVTGNQDYVPKAMHMTWKLSEISF